MDDDTLWQICQSCAKPLIREADYSTNGDGTRNGEYCRDCHSKGVFTKPDLTKEEMIRMIVEQIVANIGMSQSRAEEITRSLIPSLNRWK